MNRDGPCRPIFLAEAIKRTCDFSVQTRLRARKKEEKPCPRERVCDNTPRQPHPFGGKAIQAVSPGSPVGDYPPRKETPKSTHARRRPGEDAPSDKHELCDRKFTFPRRRPRGNTHASPPYPVRSPQTRRKPPLRHPQRTLRKPTENPLSDTLKETSENPPLRAHGASVSGERPKLRTPP